MALAGTTGTRDRDGVARFALERGWAKTGTALGIRSRAAIACRARALTVDVASDAPGFAASHQAPTRTSRSGRDRRAARVRRRMREISRALRRTSRIRQP